jgi:hypothetical protein
MRNARIFPANCGAPFFALAVAIGMAACDSTSSTAGAHGIDGAPSDCAACHMHEYTSAPHHVNERPTTCAFCHSPATWTHPRTSVPPVSSGAEPVTTVKGKHPENKFIIQTGAHEEIACVACHSLPGKVGKSNTDCVSCHTRPEYDKIHAHVSEYPGADAPANFCLKCHTQGTKSHKTSTKSAGSAGSAKPAK